MAGGKEQLDTPAHGGKWHARAQCTSLVMFTACSIATMPVQAMSRRNCPPQGDTCVKTVAIHSGAMVRVGARWAAALRAKEQEEVCVEGGVGGARANMW